MAVTSPSSMAFSPPPSNRLRIIAVGTGRDGTVSVTHMIQELFDRTSSQKAVHEYCAREFYDAFCALRETGDARFLAEIRRMIEDCPYDCIVGNGYAATLPWFVDRFPGLKLLHLVRADRDACIRSLIKNCELYPMAYGHYSTSPEAVVKRMAAFHYDEMTRQDWDRLSITEKFGWYYDKTHALIRSHKALFADSLEIETERLNDDAVRRTLAGFVLGEDAEAPSPAHLNAHSIDMATCPKELRPKMQWLMGKLNLHQLADDDVYAIDYFLNKFVAWTGYQIRKGPELAGSDPRTSEEIAAALDRAGRIVVDASLMIEQLKQLLTERRGQVQHRQGPGADGH